MEYRWQNRNLKVENVIAKAEQFLRDRKFVTRKEEGENRVRLIGVARKEKYDVRLVETVISWSPEELSIKFEMSDHLKPILHLGSLMSFWGGGSLVLKELKTNESFRKLEEDFWREMEEVVPHSSAV
ncbi:MAG: hypothetical protein ABSC91_10570 [Candidatus Bathyarchaeia archaeon]